MLFRSNTQWQLDAGNFYDKMARRFDEALVLYRRALRYAQANEGPQSLRAAQAHNNIAYALSRLNRNKEALPEQRLAAEMYAHLYGTQHELTAARWTNLGVIHYYLGHVDSAQVYFDRAEKVYTALGSAPKLHAQLLNNQAAIDVAKGEVETAYTRLKKALEIVPAEEKQDRVQLLQSMGAVCRISKRHDESQRYYQEALDQAILLYGEDHPTTIELRKSLFSEP